MRRINNFLSACLLAIAFSTGASGLPSDWQHEQRFDISRPGLLKISMPLETLNAARPGLEDLRVYDDAGNEVPCLIERTAPPPTLAKAPGSFAVSLNPDNTTLTLETGIEEPIDAVTLKSPAKDFIKAVRVESSPDGNRWEILARGRPIFRQQSGAENLKIAFPQVTAKWLRITVDDMRSAPVPFTGALIHTAATGPAPVETVAATISERDEEPGQTRLALDLGAANMDVAGLRFETSEPLFTRQISLAVPQISDGAVREQSIGQGGIYRVAVEGQASSENLFVSLGTEVQSRELIVFIRNGDSPPLPISAVRIERRPVYLVFLARTPGTFHLLTGNAHCSPPAYDLAALNMDLKSVAVSPVNIASLADNPDYRSPEVLPGLEMAGATLDTTAWKFRKRLKISAAGAQEIELDADVLAHANSGFADLRIMRGSNQVPYLVERTSISRSITPSITATNDEKNPGSSRWLIHLPQANLPLTRLACVSPTPLFQRDMRLYENVSDERGAQYQHDLGAATWTQTPNGKGREFVLTLDEPPQTDAPFLETENGDNPPIELQQFKLFYPVTRLLIKAMPDDNLFLYYGNPDAAPPLYDLSLVANELLVADKKTATLGDEELLRKPSWGGNQIAAKAGVVFWGVLALVVVVLLVVISRLLPKTSPPAS